MKDWECIAKVAYDHTSAEEARHTLAATLGVSADALRRLKVGWLPNEKAWSFPERDATGRVIGINRRFADGTKQRMAGGQSGLTYEPGHWSESAVECDHVFLVEGGSDVASMLTMGLSVVGRPSNTGGVELLAELLLAVPTDRIIVVLGEHDRKSHQSLNPAVRARHKLDCDGCSICWPGWFGAVTTATQLSERLDREIAWSFPPDGTKDVRDWLKNSQIDRTG